MLVERDEQESEPTCRWLLNTDMLSAYFDNELPECEQHAMSAHVGRCAHCRQTLDAFRAIRRLLGGSDGGAIG
jgi:anti-sigma factor RsiW